MNTSFTDEEKRQLSEIGNKIITDKNFRKKFFESYKDLSEDKIKTPEFCQRILFYPTTKFEDISMLYENMEIFFLGAPYYDCKYYKEGAKDALECYKAYFYHCVRKYVMDVIKDLFDDEELKSLAYLREDGISHLMIVI